ncbi:MAG: hypothetical protein GY745_21070 [Actinomycetia bacterium]|nr:hypothetical protein [Actinomycetes bacterium]
MAPIHLLKGDDPTLISQAVGKLVGDLVGGGDRSLIVEELTEVDHQIEDEWTTEAIARAAHTPPFLTDQRVIVARHSGKFSTGDSVKPLVDWLGDPLPTTTVVLVWEKPQSDPQGRIASVPKALKEAVKKAGGQEVDTSPKGKGRKIALEDGLRRAPVGLDSSARAAIADQLGDDLGRLESLLETLVGAHGEGATLGAADVEPYLGSAADVPPWELTDAIEAGDIALALDKLARMSEAGERHALQIMAVLHGHIGRMLRLEGSGVRSDTEAAELLGLKGSTFPAKKALEGSRRWGHDRLARATQLLAEADLGLRGGGVPDRTVMEILVARLTALSPKTAKPRPKAG